MKNLCPQLEVGGSTPVILATQEVEIRRIAVQGQPGQIVQETHLQNNQRKARDVAQVVQCLPSKLEALSSMTSTIKKTKINFKRTREKWTGGVAQELREPTLQV
jgi:hypothetical protein